MVDPSAVHPEAWNCLCFSGVAPDITTVVGEGMAFAIYIIDH